MVLNFWFLSFSPSFQPSMASGGGSSDDDGGDGGGSSDDDGGDGGGSNVRMLAGFQL